MLFHCLFQDHYPVMVLHASIFMSSYLHLTVVEGPFEWLYIPKYLGPVAHNTSLHVFNKLSKTLISTVWKKTVNILMMTATNPPSEVSSCCTISLTSILQRPWKEGRAGV
jgi:hypothetical protein